MIRETCTGKEPPKVIAEIGINHKGSMKEACKLIDKAAEANCWGVKFQFRNLSSFYSKSNEIGDGIIIEELNRIDLTINQYKELASYAHSRKIKVGVSFFRVEDLEYFSDAVDYFDFFKVPSAECTNHDLLSLLLTTNKPVMVSTGGHTEDQIKHALLPFRDKNLVVFHCVANYPATLGSQQLGFISQLSEMGFKQVGYSSHDEDIEVCLMSLCMGAQWIERHITSDKSGSGLDDSSSSEFNDFDLMNKFIQKLDGIIGGDGKILNQGEILNMQNLGTGLYINKSKKAGDIVNADDFDIRAPRKGLSFGDFRHAYMDKKLELEIMQGEPLEARHFIKRQVFDSEVLSAFAKNNLVGIPVRTHDFSKFKNIIPTGVYEFHLSYQECLSDDFLAIINKLEETDHVSIHLPDYLPGNRIIDPISTNKETSSDSKLLISRVIDIAEKIKFKIKKDVPVVGSFSERNGRSRTDILDDLFEYLDSSLFDSVKILPQWLPVNAWYFGGTATLDLFNDKEDINYLNKYQRKICLDVCHLGLSAKSHSENWRDWFDVLKPLTGHLHLADATGVDGEGLPLGSGDIGNFSEFLEMDCLKIIEVWQGHFNNGEGFLTALNTLNNLRL